MGVLQRFERRLENLVNRPFAKAFRAEVQPVEIASALQRECDNRTSIVGRGRTMVPNVFVVELGEHDHARLTPYAEPLSEELADMVREHAEEQHYTFIGPVEVRFALVDELDTGMFRLVATAVAGATPEPAKASPVSVRPHAPYLEFNGRQVAVTRQRTILGRGMDADVRLDDPGVSRRHAEVRMRGDRGIVLDLGSTNGVVVDGRRVDEAPLDDGTEFVLGSTTVVFRSGEDE